MDPPSRFRRMTRRTTATRMEKPRQTEVRVFSFRSVRRPGIAWRNYHSRRVDRRRPAASERESATVLPGVKLVARKRYIMVVIAQAPSGPSEEIAEAIWQWAEP